METPLASLSQPALVTVMTSNLNGAGYFTPSQVEALNVGVPLIQRNATTGQFKLTIGIQKSANLIDFAPFPFTAPDTVLSAGKLEFEFTVPGNAAFFRLEAQ